MAVRAYEVALRQLLLEDTGAPTPREGCEVIDLVGPGPVVECHRDGMEASAAVNARVVLQLTHTSDESLDALSLLVPPKLSGGGVVPRIPDSAARLAPSLMSLAASVELTGRFPRPAQRAPAKKGSGLFCQ
jgi:hypothetical protein